MEAIIWLVFVVAIATNIYTMWRSGEISGIFPQTARERSRLTWEIVGAVNFVAFLIPTYLKGTSAFFQGGRLVAGQYLVLSHGKYISFTPTSYWFSYVHGAVFVLVHLACMVAIWRSNQKKE